MKILIIQENGRHEISKHLRECNSMQRAIIAQGEECDVWGLGHESYNNKIDFNNYDVIINLENYDTGWMPDLHDVTKPLKFLWSIDAHVRGYEYYRDVFIKGKYNYILQATRDFCDKDSLWFPNCYDDDYIVPLETSKEHFVGFCGNFVNRKPYFDYLASKMPFKLDIDVRGLEMIRAINSYKIHFNKNISNDINYRNFETLGCKTALLTDYNSQYNDLGFIDGENVFFYKNINEAVDTLTGLQQQEDLINRVAKSGYDLVKQKHTFTSRAKSLLKFINTKI
ncbi:MAG: glycosyltransferase family protein [Minisyncoccia bacterium]